MKWWAAVFVLSLFVPLTVRADAGTAVVDPLDAGTIPQTGITPPQAQLDAPGQATVGDAIEVLLQLTTDAQNDVAVPEQPMEPFEVLDRKVETERAEGSPTQTFVFQLRLQTFETGPQSLGPFRLRVTTPKGELSYVESNAVTIDIRSPIANEPNPELKPETKPVSVEQDDYTLLWVLGAVFAMALGGLLMWLFLRWWRKRAKEEYTPPPIPAWEWALGVLRALDGRREQMLQEGRTEAWVDAVSDAIRDYLGRRFSFPGLESTTDEISGQLRRTAHAGITSEEATHFLAQCDLVKFAKAELAEEASRDLIRDALAMVERTTPRTGAQP